MRTSLPSWGLEMFGPAALRSGISGRGAWLPATSGNSRVGEEPEGKNEDPMAEARDLRLAVGMDGRGCEGDPCRAEEGREGQGMERSLLQWRTRCRLRMFGLILPCLQPWFVIAVMFLLPPCSFR